LLLNPQYFPIIYVDLNSLIWRDVGTRIVPAKEKNNEYQNKE